MRKFFKILAILVVCVLGGLLLIGFLATPDNSQTQQQRRDRVTQMMPADESALVKAAVDARDSYKSAANDMAKGAARPARMKAICAAIRQKVVRDWIGTVSTLSSNSDGKGVMSIAIGEDVYAKTWNNDVSDAMDNTLLQPDSEIFKKAVALKSGALVRFSGQLFSNPVDCIRETSVTLDGSMRSPEFLVRFTDINAVD